MWENTAEPQRPQTIWCLRIARSLPKATDTHSEYVIFIAFPLQQLLYLDASLLRYTYFACLVFPPSLAISSLSDHISSFSPHPLLFYHNPFLPSFFLSSLYTVLSFLTYSVEHRN